MGFSGSRWVPMCWAIRNRVNVTKVLRAGLGPCNSGSVGPPKNSGTFRLTTHDLFSHSQKIFRGPDQCLTPFGPDTSVIPRVRT